MRILIGNDDGVEAKGLEALAKALHKDHEVIVSAPLHQQSGMSHALTIGDSMELVENKRLQELYGIEAWGVAGTPVDGVKLYLEELGKDKQIDVVLSGINYGANLATDILYSGTVGAAREGFLHDIPSWLMRLLSSSKLTLKRPWQKPLPHSSTISTSQNPFSDASRNFSSAVRAAEII